MVQSYTYSFKWFTGV